MLRGHDLSLRLVPRVTIPHCDVDVSKRRCLVLCSSRLVRPWSMVPGPWSLVRWGAARI